MSDFVEVIIIMDENQGLDHVKKFLQKKKCNAYYRSDSSRLILALEDPIDKKIELFAKSFPRLIHLIHGEDHGWSIEIIENGASINKFSADYDYDNGKWIGETDKLIEHLGRIGADQIVLNRMANILFTKNIEDIEAQSWFLLLESLQIKLENNFSYDFFEAQSEAYWSSLGIEYFECSTTIQPKRLLIKEIGTWMNPKGYMLIKDTLSSSADYVFFKKVEGMDVGLELYVEKRGSKYICSPHFKTLYDHTTILTPSMRSFDAEHHIVAISKEIKESFERLEIEMKDSLEIEVFDHDKYFEVHIDPFMSQYGLQRKESTIATLQGGKIIYSGNKKEIHFKNPIAFIGIVVYVKRKDKMHSITEYNGKWIRSDYRNQKEYDEMIQVFLQVLKEDYLLQ